MNGPEPMVFGVAAVLSLLFLILSLRANRKRRLIANLPTSKTTGVFIGFVELKGTAEVAQPLTSYLAGASCVHYSYEVREHWSRTVTETYRDSDGKTRTRTRHESGWTTVAEGGDQIPFYLKDDHGHVLVRPEGAELETAIIFDETCGRGDVLYYAKGPPEAISDSDHRRQFVERAIPLHQELYVLGQAREREDIVAPEIAHDKNAPCFVISVQAEEKVSRGLAGAAWGWGIASLLVVLASAAWIAQGRAPERLLIPGALGWLMLFTLGWVWMVFNSMVDLRQRVNQAWSLVDVQLKRRYDLIPNLVNTVKGLRDYERTLQEELAALRSQTMATPPGVSGPDYAALTGTLVAIRERYPELKADAAFEKLQKNLADTETRIALARGYFNDIATQYNTRLESVPDGWVAGLARMRPRALMEANDFERAPVPVTFAA